MAVSGKYNLPPSPFTSFFACCAVTSLFIRVRRACLPWTPWEHTLLWDLGSVLSALPPPQIACPRPRLPCPLSLLTPWPWTGGPDSLTAAEPVLRPPGEESSLAPAQADPGVDTV